MIRPKLDFNIDSQFSKCESRCMVKFSKVYKPSVVSKLRITELPGRGVDKCYKIQSDVALLFNQQRLVKTLGSSTVDDWLGSLRPSSVGIDMSKFSDTQLMQFIKSRNIQSVGELSAWSNYLNDNAQSVIDEYNRSLDAAKQARLDEISKRQAELDKQLDRAAKQKIVNSKTT